MISHNIPQFLTYPPKYLRIELSATLSKNQNFEVVPNCVTDGSNICQSCNFGYYLSNTECKRRNIEIPFYLGTNKMQIEGYRQITDSDLTEDFLDYLGEIYEASKGLLKYQDELDIENCSFCTSNNRRFFDSELNKIVVSAHYGQVYSCGDDLNGLAVWESGKSYVTKQDVKRIHLKDAWTTVCVDKITYALFVNSDFDKIYTGQTKVGSYKKHVWYVKAKNGQHIAIFWVETQAASNYDLNIYTDFSTSVSPHNGDATLGLDYKFYSGQEQVQENLFTNGLVTTHIDDWKYSLNVINWSGQELELYWVNESGSLVDLSGTINDEI